MVLLDRPTAAGSAATASRGRVRMPALWVGVGAAAVGYLGAGIPSYWGDEAASVLSAERAWPSLAAELSTVDAVHGMYYALLHLWVSVFGVSEWSTRALSSIGIGFLAAGVVVLGRRWFDARTALLAGILIPFIPRAGVLAVETRGYAISAAAAVWVTVLFVRLVDRGARRRWWLLYGVAVALSGTFFLYLLLMPLVHLTWLIMQRVSLQTLRRWAASMLIAGVLAVPIAVSAELQKKQVGFLAHRGYMTPTGWFITPWFGHAAAAAVLIPVLLVGVLAAIRGRRGLPGALPAIVWLIAPGVILVLIDAFVSPTYNPRYLSFCLAAVALLIAVGAWAVIDLVRAVIGRRSSAVAAAALLVVGALVLVPEFVHQRTPFAKDGGADGRAAAAAVAAQGSAGDTVLFGTNTRPSRAPRLIYRLYPEAFAGMNDPQLITAAEDTDGLWDHLASVDSVAPALGNGTVWLLETGTTGSAKDDLAALTESGFVEIAHTDINRTVVYEFQKGTPS